MNSRVVPQLIPLDSITATLAAELEQYFGALYGGRRSDISDKGPLSEQLAAGKVSIILTPSGS